MSERRRYIRPPLRERWNGRAGQLLLRKSEPGMLTGERPGEEPGLLRPLHGRLMIGRTVSSDVGQESATVPLQGRGRKSFS